MSTSTDAGSTEQRKERIGRIYRSSLVEALSHRRSRRFALGGEIKAGHTAYQSQHEPVPLSKEELALLCWAAAGSTGLVLSDIDGNLGCSTQVRHPGLTTPSPCNSHTTRLLFMNDDGVFLYKPREATKPVHIESEADLERLVSEFDQDVVRLQDKRVALPDAAMVQLNIPSSNRPGQTLFMPVVNPNYEIINSLFVMIQYEKYKIVDDATGKPAGIEKWVGKLGLEKTAPLSFFMNLTVIAISMEAAFLTQNLLLMAEALGLGAFPHSGYIPLIVLGGTPLTRGLGFRFTTDKAGLPNPVGFDGVKELEGLCPPYVKTMAEAVQVVQDSKYGNGRIFSPTNPVSPFRSQAEFSRGICEVPDEVVQCVKDLCDHVYEKYGRFPSNFDTISLPIWVGVHHVDLDFYAKFYQDEAITDRIRHHFQDWHS
jgi:hypothetical protein